MSRLNKILSITLLLCLTLNFTGCSDNYEDTPSTAVSGTQSASGDKYIPPEGTFRPGTIFDDTGVDSSYEPDGLIDGTVHIEGRVDGTGEFSFSPQQFKSEYNALVDKGYQISDSILASHMLYNTKAEVFNLDVYKYIINEKHSIFVFRKQDATAGAFFSYPVAETQNGAWDYEDTINKIFSIFDEELTLEYMAKEVDVDSKEEYLPTVYYNILRKYTSFYFFIQDSIAYVGIGTRIDRPEKTIEYINEHENEIRQDRYNNSWS